MSITTYNSGSGNFTVPAGVTSLQIEVWGAGGGGGAGTAGSSAGGSGGGGGGYCKKNALTVTAGQSISYVVGAAGAAGSWITDADDASAGGNSSAYSAAYTANGGGKGRGGGYGNLTASGGTASGGDTNPSPVVVTV